MTTSVYEDMSNPEKEVAYYLKKINIQWQYQQPIYVWDDKNRPRVWSPDFYLPQLGIYIEVCGSEKFKYQYREETYKKNGIPIIFVHNYKGKKYWHKYLCKRIYEIHQYRWELIKNL